MTSPGFHELFRYHRDEEARIYNLQIVAGGVELWRVVESTEEPTRSVREDHFTSAEAATTLIQDIERSLEAGGWRRVAAGTD